MTPHPQITFAQQENLATATITLAAVKVPEMKGGQGGYNAD
ncbi:MAG: hypothetical protein V7K40_33665 [Nostoc sp.]